MQMNLVEGILINYNSLQFFKKLNGAVHSFRCSSTMRYSTLFDTTCFIRMELKIMVV